MPAILFVRSSQRFGGIERQLLWHAQRLHEAGWRVRLACLHRSEGEHPLARAAQELGLSAVTLPDPAPLSLKPHRLLRNLMKTVRPDILHTFDYRSDALAMLMKNRPIWVAETQGHTNERRRMRIWNWLDVRALRRADAVAAVSPAWETWLAVHGVSPVRITVLGNSRAILPREPLPRPASLSGSGPHLLYAGRLSPEKGVDLLLAAWPALIKRWPQARLWVLGGPPASSRYRRRIEAGLRQPGVSFLGPQLDIRPWLQAVDGVVVPSRREAWGMTAFEALCQGAPVAAARVGGLAEVCRGAAHARLFTANDVDAMGEAIITMLQSDFPRGVTLGRAYCSQPRFDPQRRHRILLTLYADML